MARTKKTAENEMSKKFVREYSMIVNGFEIVKGDMIKIIGQYGQKFRFESLTTNTETGAIWVDCFEIMGKVASTYRAFKVEDVKRIPQRGKRAKRVV
jgi:hypothetical protein